MMLVLNFLVSVVLAPAVVAGVAHFTVKDPTLVKLSAVLSALSGLVCVWDVVIRRGPKLGMDWRFPSPQNYLLITLVVYGLVVPFIVGVGLWVRTEFVTPPYRAALTFFLWFLTLVLSCLWVPHSKHGPDSGVPLSTD